jgi:hypothetical protein
MMRLFFCCFLFFLTSWRDTVSAQEADSLLHRAYTAYEQKHFVEGAILIERAISAGANDSNVLYNAACLFALSGRKEKSWYYLEKSFANGFDQFEQMQKDSDLISLRNDEKWNTLSEKIKKIAHENIDRSAIINDMNNLAAHAYQYFIRPISMSGGGGKYINYTIPSKVSSNENAIYSAMVKSEFEVEFLATSTNGHGTVTVILDRMGQLSQWKYDGDFNSIIK